MPKRLARLGACIVLAAGLSFGQRAPQERTKGSGGRGGSMAPADPDAPKGVFPTAHGTIKSIAGSQLFVDVDEDHEMRFRLIHKTKIFSQSKDSRGKIVSKEIKASSLEPGETVDIDMQVSLDGAFEAVRITVVS
ncbi:MAG: hypothetical protein ACRD4E_00170 [Bryobacteraceae bacterium]